MPIYWIDLEDVNLATGNQEEFLNGIMFQKFKKNVKVSGISQDKILDVNDFNNKYGFGEFEKTPNEYFCSTYQIQTIDGDSLYKRLTNSHEIEEHLGTYYQEDEYDEDTAGIPGAEDSVPEANKNKKRVITYIVR